MRRWLVAIALLVAAAAPARAEDLSGTYTIEAPPGFDPLPGLADKLAEAASQSHQLGDLPIDTGAQAWARAGQGALYVTWVAARERSPDPEAAIRGVFDRVRESPVAASPQAGSTRELDYRERVAAGVAEATHEWHHLSNETVSLTRALAWASPEGAVRLVKAECVYSAAETASRPACEAALASLALAVPEDQRRPLTGLGSSVAPRPPNLVAEVGGGADTGAETGNDGDGPSFQQPPAAGDRVLYRGPGGQESGGSSARTWIVVGGALLAVAAWMLWRGRGRGGDGGAAAGEPRSDSDDGERAAKGNGRARDTGDDQAGDGDGSDDEPEGGPR